MSLRSGTPLRLSATARALLSRPLKTLTALPYALTGSRAATPKGPVRVQLEVTSVCTFDCVMCNRHNLKSTGVLQHHMAFPLFEKVINETAPQYVTLSGLGDPVLYPHLGKALDLLRARGVVISLTSNLPHLTERRLEDIVRSPPDVFSFSIHGGSEQVFNAITRTDDYRRSIANFERLLKRLDRSRTNLRVSCALQRLNLADFENVWKLLERWNLRDHLHLMPVHDFQINVPGVASYMPTAAEKAEALRQLREAQSETNDERKLKFLRLWGRQLERVPTEALASNNAPCMIPWYTTYVTCQGSVVPCCLLTQRQHLLGDASKQSFDALWASAPYQRFRKNLARRRDTLAGCRNCPRSDVLPLRVPLGVRQPEPDSTACSANAGSSSSISPSLIQLRASPSRGQHSSTSTAKADDSHLRTTRMP